MKTTKSKNLYKLMQRFADVTKTWVGQGKFKRVERCLRIADTLFQNGNAAVKNAVANVFVYSIASILDEKNEQSRQLSALLPASLRNEYEHQVCSLGV